MESKYQQLAKTLREQIAAGTFAATGLLPTEKAIAEAYQLSRQTVRQALSLLAQEGLIEKRQGSGSHIRKAPPLPESAAPRSIAILTTYISDYIFPSILREVETVLSANRCTTLVFASKNQISNERRVLHTLLELPQLDGLLVEGTKTCLPNPNLDLYRQLIARGIPLVFLNGSYAELAGSSLSVLDDNYGGGYALVEYLYRKGHRQIAGIFKSDDIQGHGRFSGYTDALRDLHLSLRDSHVYWYGTEEKDRIIAGPSQSLPDAMLEILEGCTAVVCYNDEIASRLIASLIKRGVRVPEDMAVVSFDNSQYSELSPVRITSLSHGSYNAGRSAAELLLQLLEGKSCQSQVLPWVLEEKESS